MSYDNGIQQIEVIDHFEVDGNDDPVEPPTVEEIAIALLNISDENGNSALPYNPSFPGA